MGLLGWLFGSNDNKSSQRASYYYERQANMKKINEARERWANSQKEAYRQGGTTALGLTVGMDEETGIPLSDTRSGVDEQAEFEDTENELRENEAMLKADIEQYKIDKADAISRYSNPE